MKDIDGIPDQLAHRDFDPAHGIVQATVDVDLPPLAAAVQRMLARRRASPEPPNEAE